MIACRPFRKLEKLECCGNGVGDEGVKELIWLQSLQHLCLGQNPRITDKSSLFLSGLARLRTLNLTGTQLTNNGILPLRALTVSLLVKILITSCVWSLTNALHHTVLQIPSGALSASCLLIEIC